MKKIFVILFFLTANRLFAQDYLSGKLTDEKSAVHTILYDRTQLLAGNKTYQTLYKVMDENKKNLYTIYITHDNDKATVSISVNVTAGETRSKTINYDPQKCGFIFSDAGNLDTIFPATKAYAYLFSFTDVTRDYPVLHKIKTSDGKELELDPLTRLRIKKHNELVKKFGPLVQHPSTAIAVNGDEGSEKNSLVYSLLNDSFNNQLFALRDSLYNKNAQFIDVVTKIKAAIESDYEMYMKEAHAYSETEKYGGQERNGQADGKGLMVNDGNIYDGTFAAGRFISGQSVLKTKGSVYYGESISDTMNGKGWLKYSNGSFLLGEFKNGKLADGISLSKENEEVFFGTFKNNRRTGYGELRNSRGDRFYGEFLNGRLIKGYSKEVDQFGYATYSRIQNGSKASVPAQMAEIFFDKVHVLKDKAEAQP